MLKSLILATIIGLFSGCGASYKTVIVPDKTTKNVVHLEVDQDSTGLSMIQTGNVMRTNYRYSFAVAATTTINKGFTYFSIAKPHDLINQYRNREVLTIQDAYDACNNGSGNFRMAINLSLEKKLLKVDSNNCDAILHGWSETTIRGTTAHENIHYYIKMHNENRKDNITFNAKDVLKSDLIKGLNPEYFVPMTR